MPLIELRDISKSYGAAPALRGVSFAVERGEIRALLGANGAGKSTLMKILLGVTKPDSGSIVVAGVAHAALNPQTAAVAGVHMVHQEFSLVPGLSIAENISLGRLANCGGFVSWRTVANRARAVAERVGIRASLDTPVESLSIAEQQLVEIAKALASSPQTLILDEPTAALTHPEVQRLFAIVTRLAAEGVAVVLVTHRLNEVKELCRTFTVLRDGAVLAAGQLDDATVQDLAGLISSSAEVSPPAAETEALHLDSAHPDVLVLREVSTATQEGSMLRSLDRVTVSIRGGEVLALAGLAGSGRTELARVLVGLDAPSGGRMELDGESYAPASPTEAWKAGVMLAPEDRRVHGLVMSSSIADNLVLSCLQRLARMFGFLSPSAVERTARGLIAQLGISARSPDQPVAELSGGNQQKVVVGRVLGSHPRVVVLDEPTRGVDVRAKHEMFRLAREMAGRGMAIVFISSELEEIPSVADRVLLMRHGQICGELRDQEITINAVVSGACT